MTATLTRIAGRRPGKRCAAGCGWPLDPAAAAGYDGTPGVYDRHPGCEPASGQHLRLIHGGKTA